MDIVHVIRYFSETQCYYSSDYSDLYAKSLETSLSITKINKTLCHPLKVLLFLPPINMPVKR